jgi:hypothetical protein
LTCARVVTGAGMVLRRRMVDTQCIKGALPAPHTQGSHSVPSRSR